MSQDQQQLVKKQRHAEAVKWVDMASKKQADILRAMRIDPAVFLQVVTNALVANPEIAKCTPASIYQACTKAATLGLLPDGISAAIIPRGGKATFEAMVTGILGLIRKAFPGISVVAHSVWEDDEFHEQRGTDPKIHHLPNPEASHADENLFAVYACLWHPANTVPEFEVMYRPEILRFKAQAASQRGPWLTHFAEMAEVRPLKRLGKRLGYANAQLTFALQEYMHPDEEVTSDAPDKADPKGQPDTIDVTAQAPTPEKKRGRPRREETGKQQAAQQQPSQPQQQQPLQQPESQQSEFPDSFSHEEDREEHVADGLPPDAF